MFCEVQILNILEYIEENEVSIYIINVFRIAFNSLNVRQERQINPVFYSCFEQSPYVINS